MQNESDRETHGKEENEESESEESSEERFSIFKPPDGRTITLPAVSTRAIKKVVNSIGRGDWKTVEQICKETSLYEPEVRNTFTYFRRVFNKFGPWCRKAYGIREPAFTFRDDKTEENHEGNNQLKLYCIEGAYTVFVDRNSGDHSIALIIKRAPRKNPGDCK